MTLLALITSLALERLFTHMLHLREARWHDRWVDQALVWYRNQTGIGRTLVILLAIVIPVVPVLLVQVAIRDDLAGVPYLVFAIFVLIFSLGPRDLSGDVESYARAAEDGDSDELMLRSKSLLETDPPKQTVPRVKAVSEAIFVQANNRIFGIVLWFAVLGPVGAWLFRVSELIRRRTAFEADRNPDDKVIHEASQLLQQIHGVLSWLPARLVAIGYALAGSFEDAIADWRQYYEEASSQFFQVNEEVVACVGCGALARRLSGDDDERTGGGFEAGTARSAMALVNRSLIIWLTVIALLTLAGWAV